MCLEETRGDAGPVTASTDDDDRTVSWYGGKFLWQIAQHDVRCTFDVSGTPFFIASHIQHICLLVACKDVAG
jgi:hypothetical protein